MKKDKIKATNYKEQFEKCTKANAEILRDHRKSLRNQELLLAKEYDQTIKEKDKEIKLLDKVCKGFAEEKKDLLEEIDELMQNVREKTEEIEKLKKQLEYSNECLQQMGRDEEELKAEVEKLRERVNYLDTDMENMINREHTRLRAEIEKLKKEKGDCETIAIMNGVALGNNIVDFMNEKIKKKEPIRASEISEVMKNFFLRFERGNEKYIDERIKQKDAEWQEKIEKGELIERKEIEKIIEKIENPIYKCECGWKGKEKELKYDNEAIEWSCPKCGREIDLNIVKFPLEHLKKDLLKKVK